MKIDLLKKSTPFIAFVGAGASTLPPSNLPTWFQFNDLFLECLCERLAVYSRNRQPTEEMLSAFRTRRDKTGFFAPDFQAQLMEEEIGPEYFRVWQSLKTDEYGPVHAGLAELASQKRLWAVITTNFDTLSECALQEKGVPYDVFHNATEFEALAKIIEKGHPARLPVIKIHGSIEDADSLIDTLKQRLAGRPASLTKSIELLLGKYPWLYLGFSGADFSYDPHYLGILDAVETARGFVFVARNGSEIQDGVQNLADAYGLDKAEIVYGDLSTWLAETFKLTIASPARSIKDGENSPSHKVKDRIRSWVDSLGYMAVVNITYAMLKSAGMEADAAWLLRKTWKSYRLPEDVSGKSYDRYSYNYGMTLLETGFIRNPISLKDDMSNLPAWKEAADQNAFEFFARSYGPDKILAAGAQLASVLAYRGDVQKAAVLASDVTDKAVARGDGLELCDIAIASAAIYDIVRIFDPASLQLQHCLEIAGKLGDEPRRAMLSAHLGRFLTYGGHFEEADRKILEAERIAQRLGLQPALLASRAARGRWLTDSGTSDQEAVCILQGVADEIRALDDLPLFTKVDLANPKGEPIQVKGHHPTLCRVLLDLNRSAYFAGNTEVINQTLDELDELTIEHFPGYCPHYYFGYVECILSLGDTEKYPLAMDLVGRAREVGKQSGNPWAAQEADRLQEHLKRSSRP